jgi:hypothetical protein
VFLLLLLGALGYAISTQIEDAQFGANLIEFPVPAQCSSKRRRPR